MNAKATPLLKGGRQAYELGNLNVQCEYWPSSRSVRSGLSSSIGTGAGREQATTERQTNQGDHRTAGVLAGGAPGRSRSLLHAAFETGIALKGIDGLLEIVGGLLLWQEKRVALNHVVKALTQHELSEDPHDFVATRLVRAVRHFGHGEKRFAALYLGLHGVVKIVLVAALWRNKLWAYPAMIAVLLGFIGYQIYRMSLTPTIFLAGLTAIDAVVVWLTLMEYRRQERRGR